MLVSYSLVILHALYIYIYIYILPVLVVSTGRRDAGDARARHATIMMMMMMMMIMMMIIIVLIIIYTTCLTRGFLTARSNYKILVREIPYRCLRREHSG